MQHRFSMIVSLVILGSSWFSSPAFAPPSARPVETIRQVPREVKPIEGETVGKGLFEKELKLPRNSVRDYARDLARNSWYFDLHDQPEYSVLDSVHTAEDREALGSYLRSDPVAHEIGITSWRLSTPPKLQQIHEIIQLAQRKLPGRVELGLFLDDTVFGDAAKNIKLAWGDRPISPMPHTDLLDEHLSGRSGQTLIAVGHVEGPDFVMRDAGGREMRLTIQTLLSKGLEHNVLVIPIGCKTAGASAPFGFLENIDTDAVQMFVNKIVHGNMTIADLIAGLREMGEIRVNLKDALDQLEIQVDPRKGGAGQVSHVKLPYEAVRNGQDPLPSRLGNGVSFEEEILGRGDALRPWWRKNWITELLDGPLPFLLLWTMISVMAWSWRRRMMRTLYVSPNSGLFMALGFPAIVNQWVIVIAGLFAFAFVLNAWPWILLVAAGLGAVMMVVEFITGIRNE